MTRTATATAVKPCACGTCKQTTRGTYAPGHDARHVGLVAREVARTGDVRLLNQLPTAALHNKADRMATALMAKPAKSVKATATAPVQPVKVGRWTYPAMIKDGALLRNTKRDGSGEWIAA